MAKAGWLGGRFGIVPCSGSANEMTVHMVNGQGEITALLNDAEASQRAVDQIAREARHYHGVNLTGRIGTRLKEQNCRR